MRWPRVPVDSKTLDWPRKIAAAINWLIGRVVDWSALSDYADDAAAAAGGVEVGALYRTGSIIKVRVS